MSQLAQTSTPPSGVPRIETCAAEFHVSAPTGPLSTPETLLDTLRRELLPTLSEVLESPPYDTLDIRLDRIEIDLGEWPDDPTWSSVRAIFAGRLRSALDLYREEAVPGDAAPTLYDIAQPQGPPSPGSHLHQFLKELGSVPAKDRLVKLHDVLEKHPEQAEALSRERADPDSGIGARLEHLLGVDQKDLPRLFTREITPEGSEEMTMWRRRAKLIDRLPEAVSTDVATVLQTARETWPELFVTPSTPGQKAGTAHVANRIGLSGNRLSAWQNRIESAYRHAGHDAGDASKKAVELLSRLMLHPGFASAWDSSDQPQAGPRSEHSAPPDNQLVDTNYLSPRDRSGSIESITEPTPSDMPVPMSSNAQHLDGTASRSKTAAQRPSISAAPAVDGVRLRSRWKENEIAVTAGLNAMETPALNAIALGLVPAHAELLRQSLTALASTVDAPKAALTSAILDLLSNRPVDLEAARRMGDGASLLQEASRARNDDATSLEAGDGTTRDGSAEQATAIASLLAATGFEPHDIMLILEDAPPIRTPSEPLPADSTSNRANQSSNDRGSGLGESGDLHDVEGPVTSERHGRSAATDSAGSNTEVSPYREHGRIEADQRVDLARKTARMDALLDAGLDHEGQQLREMMDMIQAAWPSENNGSDDQIALDDALTRRRWRGLLADMMATTRSSEDRASRFARMLGRFEPDERARATALRYVIARLSYGNPSGLEADPRLRTRLVRLLRDQILAGPEGKFPVPPSRIAEIGKPTEDRSAIVTEAAGLILLHPFLKLLFERLGVLSRDGKIDAELRPRAHAILFALAPKGVSGSVDPLYPVLLGLPQGALEPVDVTLELEATEMIESLLRSVIERWGRLGQTSTEGLRETFVIRTGTLRFDETGTHLRVAPGPFDMLLDGLPWSLGPIALPWMPEPCHVSWRDGDE